MMISEIFNLFDGHNLHLKTVAILHLSNPNDIQMSSLHDRTMWVRDSYSLCDQPYSLITSKYNR